MSKQLLLDLGDEYAEILSKYRERIASNNAVPIFDVEHLSCLVGYDSQLIYAISNRAERFYSTYRVRKKSGGYRIIDEPLPTLKEIQRWLLVNVVAPVTVSRAARAFKKGNTLRGNALIHAKQPTVLRIDVTNFFGSIIFSEIRRILFEIGYTIELATVLANLCCLNGRLPQGAPTSPALSNIFMKDFDERLLSLCKNDKLRYTRYADDITISGDFDHLKYIGIVKRELKARGLRVNRSKTGVSRNGSRKLVTGLVVNDGVSVPRTKKRDFRKQVYFIRRWGLDGHMRHESIQKRNYLEHLIGIGVFIQSVHPKDDKIRNDVKYLRELSRIYV